MKAKQGEWVEIQQVILQADERTAKVPEDTKSVTLHSFIQGYLEEDAIENESASITTLIGRKHTGKLVDTHPTFNHDFGQPIKELLPIGQELKEFLYKKDEGGEID